MKGGPALMTQRIYMPLALMALVLTLQNSSALDLSSAMKKRIFGDLGATGQGMNASATTLDNSIDPENYIVGGGDVFQVSIVGMPSQQYFATVDQDGNLYISDLGLITLGKIPLIEAKNIIAHQVKGILKKNHEIYVNLQAPKSPVVTVGGILSNPGTHRLEGTKRLLDAITTANLQRVPDIRAYNFREVKISNRDSTQIFDLLRFMVRHDLSQNPYLYPGDNITLESVNRRAMVTGEVIDFDAEWIPIKKNETLEDILDIVRLKSSADTTSIYVQTQNARGMPEIMKYSLAQAPSVLIPNNSVVTVPGNSRPNRITVVSIGGNVARPGKYPIVENETTVADVLSLAGGLVGSGTFENAYVLQSAKTVFNSENGGKNPFIDENYSQEISSRQQMDMALINLQKSRPEINASLFDLHKMGDYRIVEIKNHRGHIKLSDGDEIYFPEPEKFVHVSGGVERPGAYPYVKGKTTSYYIKQAGGYSRRADRQNEFLIGNYQKLVKIKGVNELAAGDIIVVPSSIEFKRYMSVYMPIIQMVPAILSLVITIMIYQKSP